MELIKTRLINDPSLLAYYRYEGDGNDYTGNYNGSVSGVTFGTAYGQYHQGGSFNGAQGILVSSAISTGTAQVSLCTWVYIPSTSDKGVFLKIGTSNGYGIGIGSATFDNSGNAVLAVYEGARWIIPSQNYGTGWHHLVLNIGATGNPNLYLDGTFVYSDNLGGPVAPSGESTIGYNYDSSRYFTGYLDDTAVFSRTLNQQEITLLASPLSSDSLLLADI